MFQSRGHSESHRQNLVELAVDQRYSSKASDFNSLLSLIKSQNVDAILVAGHETEILNFIRQAKTLDVTQALFLYGGCHDRRLPQSSRTGRKLCSWYELVGTSRVLKDEYFGDAEQFAGEYQKRFGYEADYHAASGTPLSKRL